MPCPQQNEYREMAHYMIAPKIIIIILHACIIIIITRILYVLLLSF